MEDLKMNHQARKRFLFRRAKRLLEKRGLGLKKTQNGGFIVFDGQSEKPISQFNTIEEIGVAFGFWGLPLPNPDRPDHDVITDKDTPLIAATRERGIE